MIKKNTQTILRWDILKTAIFNQIIIVSVVFIAISMLLASFIVSEIRKNSANIVSAINVNVTQIFNYSTQSLDEIYHLYLQELPLGTEGGQSHQERIFNIFRNSDSTIEGIMILDGKGVLVSGASSEGYAENTDYASQAFVKNIPKVGDVFWTGVGISDSSGLPTAFVSKRFEKYIVVIQLNLKDIGNFIEHFKLSDKSEITITDNDGVYIINTDGQLVKNREIDPYIQGDSEALIAKYKKGYFIPYVSEIQGQGWKIVVYQSVMDYTLPTIVILLILLIVFVVLIIFVNWLNYRSLNIITEDLNLLEVQALEISKGNYEFRPMRSKYYEIEMLSESFKILIDNIKIRENDIETQNQRILNLNESLERQVRERTFQLESTNGELSDAYSNLKEAQNLIVQNEKLAALGQMISGMAHEMNTPIGNAFTASTYIKSVSKDLSTKVLNNEIKRGSFLEMVDEIENGSDIIYRNLQIASELIFSFKQISADHQTMECRKFELREILKNIVVSFGIDIRNANIQIEFLCEEGIIIDSYPGAIVHVVSNLIRNALIHGFEGRSKGLIRIEVFEFTDTINIMIQDDGIGMSEEVMNQIYDPFFTTKRAKGGTGLGLNIVHNMVTNVLQGSITCTSVLGKGTQFNVRFPKMTARIPNNDIWN